MEGHWLAGGLPVFGVHIPVRTCRLALLLALAAVLAACGAASTPTAGFESPLATPTPDAASETAQPSPAAVISPQPGTGGAAGRIVDSVTGQPVIDRALFLGTWSTMTSKEGEESPFVVMLPSTSPQATVDGEGNFSFSNVEPGDYGIVLWTPMQSFVAANPDTEQAYVVTIEPDQVTELGTIVVDAKR